MLHVGLDMHKRFSVVTVIGDDGEDLVSGKRIENQDVEIRSFFEELGDDVRVVLEAGPSWYWLCDLLDEMEVQNTLCHPLKTKAIASARIKSDKIDSNMLANLLRMNFVPTSYKPDMAVRHLRELLRYRASLVKIQTRIKNKIHSMLAKLNISNPYTDLFGKGGMRYLARLELAPVYRIALDGYLSVLAELKERIFEAESHLKEAEERFPDVELLVTVPGIGRLLALTILAEIGEIDRFDSPHKLASHAGLVPSTSQSGSTLRHGRITRQGSTWLRWALVEASIHVTAKPGPLKKFFLRLSRRKGNKIARVATARKLSNYIYYMLKEKKDYGQIAMRVKSDLG